LRRCLEIGVQGGNPAPEIKQQLFEQNIQTFTSKTYRVFFGVKGELREQMGIGVDSKLGLGIGGELPHFYWRGNSGRGRGTSLQK